jgi:hypothetical protein
MELIYGRNYFIQEGLRREKKYLLLESRGMSAANGNYAT